MAVKSVSIRIEEAMLEKIGYVADYEGNYEGTSRCNCWRTASAYFSCPAIIN